MNIWKHSSQRKDIDVFYNVTVFIMVRYFRVVHVIAHPDKDSHNNLHVCISVSFIWTEDSGSFNAAFFRNEPVSLIQLVYD